MIKKIMVITLDKVKEMVALSWAKKYQKMTPEEFSWLIREGGVITRVDYAAQDWLFGQFCEDELGNCLTEGTDIDQIVVEVGDPKSVDATGDKYEVIWDRVWLQDQHTAKVLEVV